MGESRAAEEHSEVNAFVLLIPTQYVLKHCCFRLYGDDMESQDEDVEVIFVSSDSNSSSPKPARRVCTEVPVSHPDAHLDPNFLLKKAGYTPKRHTRSHSGDILSGLPEKMVGRKRQS